ncbi:MAG: PQQ-binding-like beta-propeller repeat protein [Chryseolinea sp.]
MKRPLLVWFLPSAHCVSAFAVLAVLLCCEGKTRMASVVWTQNLPVTGSESSARATDLNGDGVKDIVLGAGRNERQATPQGVLALDGKTGVVLWQQEASDQMYGSATLLDATGDGVEDIFIGGRGENFKALDGKSGNILWEFKTNYENDSILKHARYNFNSSVRVPDQNHDGIEDILTVNGGNSLALPGSEKDRHPGVLMVFDAKSGRILAADTMPDGKESYMSPITFKQPSDSEPTIIFGTGGETIGGNLYLTKLSSLMKRNLKESKIIATERGHGFVASPSAADINDDGFFDVVAISHGSSVFAIDGKDQHVLWQRTIPGTESSNSFAVGNFTNDTTPDFFTFVSKGEWPNNTGSVQIMLNGKNGEIDFRDSIGCTGFSSPVIYDLNNDGMDEAIISINDFDCNKGFVSEAIGEISNIVMAIDFRKRAWQKIDEERAFKNIFSTPWLGDLDGNGYLDLVYQKFYSRGGLLVFLGMQVKRVELPVKMDKKPTWGQYLGADGDGTYKSR